MDPAFSSEGWEFCPRAQCADRWFTLVKRLFVIRHLQQWFHVAGRALQLYRSEIRDRVSKQLGGPGK